MTNLYIVATPIGNLQDITLRAAKILTSVPYIFAESASKADILLKFVKNNNLNDPNTPNIPKIISYSEDEEENKLSYLIKILDENDAALISEAGTPLISDPGFKLVREAIKREINIIPIPGASSPIAALSASGLPTDKFMFVGYLPKQKSKALKLLESLKMVRQEIRTTFILFESPHRLDGGLEYIRSVFGNTEIVVAHELTKIHESFLRGKISEIQNKNNKGEYVIIF